jgi:hypothetical protein
MSSSSAGNSDSPNTVALEKELGNTINEINKIKAESLYIRLWFILFLGF